MEVERNLHGEIEMLMANMVVLMIHGATMVPQLIKKKQMVYIFKVVIHK
jgi:hypothetical protein